MMTPDYFRQLTVRIMSLGYDEPTAADYAARIGDTPELDPSGRTVVRDDDGAILASLNLNWEE